jgi:hypothetical protein
MSWFKHSPPKYPPSQKHLPHHRHSAASDKFMEEAKEVSRPMGYKKSKIKDKLQPKTPGT